jgi:hypothetical protein
MTMARKQKLLEDATYDEQVERLSGLKEFPLLPGAQKELRRALRRITETDLDFLKRLIADIVDTATICPTPHELIQRAGAIRNRRSHTLGNPDCPKCHGTGFVAFTRRIRGACGEYDYDFASSCQCRGTTR